MLNRLKLIFAALLWAAAVLAGPAAADQTGTGEPPGGVAVPIYRLSAGDILRIQVFGHPDVSGQYEIDAGGSITFPLLGRVPSEGLSVTELKTQLAAALDRDYLVDPRVSVEVLNFRPFFILGQVNKPGSYPYRNGLDIRQAVALAGGYTRRARTSSMTIVRVSRNQRQEVAATEDTAILPGDTIEISRRLF
jgi:polysaccharide export outer membrane protein